MLGEVGIAWEGKGQEICFVCDVNRRDNFMGVYICQNSELNT